ncbi:hypothetical protein IMZ08_00420 [Bacillus luteolus]|uniref:Uncharacterized protein n=1 Tax=Litchfieldia luteola TaxID=682179 RepID=A0ABR9QDE7_9BACI|nr:hypothetical protein [Cytobacillus luteolus]MBE4906519.1 hypothetical protein [Cytobacillus luteolus]MBP1941202.1 uncharacterized protein YxeA [Cytobacillus luteolus]
MKKSVKTYALVILVIITGIAMFDNHRISEEAVILQSEKDKLVEQVASLEKEDENKSNSVESLEHENKRLVGELSELEKEVEGLKTTVNYQDFLGAISTVESYQVSKTFKETHDYFLNTRGLGFSYSGTDATCPCEFLFNGRSFEWVPNAIQELKKFRAEGNKVYLTYQTNEDIKHYNYQFVMAKGEGMFENKEEAWRIEVIEKIRK